MLLHAGRSSENWQEISTSNTKAEQILAMAVYLLFTCVVVLIKEEEEEEMGGVTSWWHGSERRFRNPCLVRS